MQRMWEKYGEKGTNQIFIVQAEFSGTWESINTTWRNKFNPKITFYLTTGEFIANNQNKFIPGIFVPHSVMIGKGKKLIINRTGENIQMPFPTEKEILDAISDMQGTDVNNNFLANIKEKENRNKISISNKKLTLINFISGNYEISIFNVQGKIMSSFIANIDKNMYSYANDISPGIYLISVKYLGEKFKMNSIVKKIKIGIN